MSLDRGHIASKCLLWCWVWSQSPCSWPLPHQWQQSTVLRATEQPKVPFSVFSSCYTGRCLRTDWGTGSWSFGSWSPSAVCGAVSNFFFCHIHKFHLSCGWDFLTCQPLSHATRLHFSSWSIWQIPIECLGNESRGLRIGTRAKADPCLTLLSSQVKDPHKEWNGSPLSRPPLRAVVCWFNKQLSREALIWSNCQAIWGAPGEPHG